MYTVLVTVVFMINVLTAIFLSIRLFQANWIWRTLIFVLALFSINTFSCLIGFYIGGNAVNRWVILGTNIVLLLIANVTLLKCSITKITIECPSTYIFFGIFFIIFSLLLLSTGREFLPIWGNTDDIHHFEMVSLFYNELALENPLPYRGLGNLSDKIEQFSYLWAYHYNCSLFAYVFRTNIFFAGHILRCFAVALMVACPITMLRKGKVSVFIAYFLLLCFNYNMWYSYLGSGYTPNIFSLMVCFNVIGILCNVKNEKMSNMEKRVLLPGIVVIGMASFLISGVFLLLFVCYYYYRKKELKSIGWVAAWNLLLIPQPSVWKQLVYFASGAGEANPAIVNSKWMSAEPPVIWLLFAGISIGAFLFYEIKDGGNIHWEFLLASITVVIGVLYMLDRQSYMIHKVILMAVLPLILFIIDTFGKLCAKANNKIIYTGAFCIISAVALWGLNKADITNVVMKPFPIWDAKRQITKDGMNCFDYLANTDEYVDYGMEYLGADGPTAYMGDIILGRRPYSYIKEDNKWRFTGNFSAQNFIDAVMRKGTKKGGGYIIALKDMEKLQDNEFLEKYKFLFEKYEKLFSSGNQEVWEYIVDDKWSISSYDTEHLSAVDDIEKKLLPGYGESVIMKEKEKETLLKMEGMHNLSFINFTGRVINGSQFVVRGIKEGEIVYEKQLEEFDGSYLLMLDDTLDVDEIVFSVISKVYSDSVIINSIYAGSENK